MGEPPNIDDIMMVVGFMHSLTEKGNYRSVKQDSDKCQAKWVKEEGCY